MLSLRLDARTIDQAQRVFAEYPQRLSRALRVAMKNSVAEVMFRLKSNVHVRTGNLRRGWQAKPLEQAGDGVGWIGGMGADVPYAAAEEFGKDQEEQVREYVRRNRVTRMTSSGKRRRLPKAVIEASGTVTVHAHTRHAKQPAHPYARPAMQDGTEAIVKFHELAVKQAARGGGTDV